MRIANLHLNERLRRVIADSSTPLWFPKLSQDLTDYGWQRLNEQYGFSRGNYGTNRLLLSSVEGGRNVELTIHEGTGPGRILVEGLPREAWRRIGKGVVPSKIDELNATKGGQILAEAFRALKEIGSLHTTVFGLVRSLHLLRADESGEYDISFSEPHIPFSIFVSVPHRRCRADFLRVAESIIHEAMHLQLTLMNEIVPLTHDEAEELYSPWSGGNRPAYGVLHGLYVFGVLREFYRQVLVLGRFAAEREFVNDRCETISSQMTEVLSLENSASLTECGRAMVRRIRNLRETHPENL